MKVNISHIQLQLTHQELITLKSQMQLVKSHDFDPEKLTQKFNAEGKLLITLNNFKLMKRKLDSILAGMDFPSQMKTKAWKDFFEVINLLKV